MSYPYPGCSRSEAPLSGAAARLDPLRAAQPFAACPACGARGREPFYEARNVPTASCLLMDSRAEALGHRRGDIVLAFCAACGSFQKSSRADVSVSCAMRALTFSMSKMPPERLDPTLQLQAAIANFGELHEWRRCTAAGGSCQP